MRWRTDGPQTHRQTHPHTCVHAYPFTCIHTYSNAYTHTVQASRLAEYVGLVPPTGHAVALKEDEEDKGEGGREGVKEGGKEKRRGGGGINGWAMEGK